VGLSAKYLQVGVGQEISTLMKPYIIMYNVTVGVDQLSGFDPTVHSSGFSSFRMASHFLECLGLGKLGVDVVSDSENIKKLLKMPYSQNPVSLV
jgi:hypothetical protein